MVARCVEGRTAMTLPDVAQRKLQQLSQQATDAMALRDAAKKQTGDVEHRAQLLINSKASEADVAKAMAAVEAAQDLQQERWKRWQADEELVTRVRAWLNELPRGTQLEAAPVPLISTNGPPAHILGGLRSQISALAISITASGRLLRRSMTPRHKSANWSLASVRRASQPFARSLAMCMSTAGTVRINSVQRFMTSQSRRSVG